jgi:hypothetical protein
LKLTHYGVDGPVKGICKQSAVWGREGHSAAPLVFLQRPKWIKDDLAWKKIIESIQLRLPKGFEIK